MPHVSWNLLGFDFPINWCSIRGSWLLPFPRCWAIDPRSSLFPGISSFAAKEGGYMNDGCTLRVALWRWNHVWTRRSSSWKCRSHLPHPGQGRHKHLWQIVNRHDLRREKASSSTSYQWTTRILQLWTEWQLRWKREITCHSVRKHVQFWQEGLSVVAGVSNSCWWWHIRKLIEVQTCCRCRATLPKTA